MAEELSLTQQQAIALAQARMRADQEAQQDPRNGLVGKVDSAVRGAADILTLGFADELAAGADAAFNPVFSTGQQGNTFGERYDKNLAQQRATDKADADQRFGYRLTGQIPAAVAGGVGLARSGLSLATRSVQRGSNLARVAGASSLDGGAISTMHGFGTGEGLEDRATQAGIGGALGLGVGAAAPLAVAGVSTVARPLVAPIMSRLRPDQYAGDAIATTLQRSGRTPDQVVGMLRDAQADSQGVFNVADALGNAGQRALSTVVRNPHNERQTVVDQLMQRQAGQGRRISGALSEAFEAPETAAQATSRLTTARRQSADEAYGAARANSGPVDVLPAVRIIDEIAPQRQGRPAHDSIESALSGVRARLQGDQGVRVTFSDVLRVRHDVGDMVEEAARRGAGNRARMLGQVRDALDEQLSLSSQPYAAARDQFAQQSRVIDAVPAGTNAAQRGRIEDTIPDFRAMTPEQQAAFRIGYAEPMIANTQSAAVGVNKARPLINDATAAEFPAIAAPGRADQLGRRLAREQQMFETTNVATGGSRTADNLADASDFTRFDPGVMQKLFSGRPVAAATEAITRALTAARGQPAPVIERMARILMETRPDVAQQMLTTSQRRGAQSQNTRALINAIVTNLGAAPAGRLAQ